MTNSEFQTPLVRTVLASFLFVDLVGFSKVSTAEQHSVKAALVDVLSRHLSALDDSDYRLRDTGDGALISFLTNPEHALFLVLAVAHDCGPVAPGQGLALSQLRMGINLGAVKESLDVESRPNYVGDGINSAQRVMDMAQPGQITASRSFMDGVSHLDTVYADLFHPMGAQADKHGRKHELFSITPDEMVLERLRRELASVSRNRPLDLNLDSLLPMPAMTGPASLHSEFPGVAATVPPRAGPRWPWIAAASLGGAAALAIVLALWSLREPAAPASSAAAPAVVAPVAAPASEPAAPQAAAPVATPAPASASAAAPKAAEAEPPAATPAPSPAVPSVPAPGAPATAAAAPTPAPAPAAKAATAPSPAHAAAPAPAKARTPARPAAEPVPEPAPASAAAPKRDNQRCVRIVEKAAVGEPLTPAEQKELANSCR